MKIVVRDWDSRKGIDAAFKMIESWEGLKASPCIDVVGEIKSKLALFLPEAGEMPSGAYEALRMQHLFYRVSANADIEALFKRVKQLPEYRSAFKQWQSAYIRSLGLPLEVTISFLKLIVRRDLKAVSRGIHLKASALTAIARKWPDPEIVWAPIAIAAAQGNLKLVRSLLEKLRRRRKTTAPLRSLQYQYWFPMMLWLMDDQNGCAALNHVCSETFGVDAYRVSRQRLRLSAYTNGFSVVNTLPGGKLGPKPSPWLLQKLSQQFYGRLPTCTAH